MSSVQCTAVGVARYCAQDFIIIIIIITPLRLME